jgi:hypothetical protein
LLLIQLISDSIISTKPDILVYFNFGSPLGVVQYCLHARWREYVGGMGKSLPSHSVVSDSNVSRKTAILIYFILAFFSPSIQLPGFCPYYTTAASFHILSNSQFTAFHAFDAIGESRSLAVSVTNHK